MFMRVLQKDCSSVLFLRWKVIWDFCIKFTKKLAWINSSTGLDLGIQDCLHNRLGIFVNPQNLWCGCRVGTGMHSSSLSHQLPLHESPVSVPHYLHRWLSRDRTPPVLSYLPDSLPQCNSSLARGQWAEQMRQHPPP